MSTIVHIIFMQKKQRPLPTGGRGLRKMIDFKKRLLLFADTFMQDSCHRGCPTDWFFFTCCSLRYASIGLSEAGQTARTD